MFCICIDYVFSVHVFSCVYNRKNEGLMSFVNFIFLEININIHLLVKQQMEEPQNNNNKKQQLWNNC